MKSIWLAVDKDDDEFGFAFKPIRRHDYWFFRSNLSLHLELSKGTIKTLIGRELTWNDEPVEYKGIEQN